LIYNNAELNSIEGLKNILSVGGSLYIESNSKLESLAGLDNIKSLGEYLYIADNDVLNDISGIRNIDPSTVKSTNQTWEKDLNIFNNPQLSECAMDLCPFVTFPGLTTDIHDNATGCDSRQEVEASCSPPACTHLTSPVNDAEDVAITTNLSWAPSANADGYLLQVGTSHGGSELLNIDVGNVTTWDPPETFECDQDFYVTIHPYNSNPMAIACNEEVFHTEKVIASAGNDVSICRNGNVQLQASGGTIFIWTPATGLNDPNISNPVASPTVTATYTVMVKNANGCLDTDEITVTVNQPPVPNATATNETGNGFKDGTATCNPTGASPFTYAWSNGESTQTISDLAPGNYTLTVTDAKGCTAEETVSVSAFGCQELTISSSLTNVSCKGACDGSVTITGVTNGVAPYTYAWSNGKTTQTISGLCAGDYYVTVTDSKNCSVTSENFTITEPEALVLTVTSTGETGNSFKDGTATCNPTGVAPFTYAWSNGGNTQTISGLTPGSYTVTVTDANGCTASNTVSVAEFGCQDLKVNVNQSNVSCNGACDGSISVTGITNGVAPYTYAWSNGETSQDISGLCAGDYYVTVTDSKNCSVTSETYTITEPIEISIGNITVNNISESSANGSVQVSVSGGTSPYAYSWTGPNAFTSSLQNPGNLEKGCYYLTVTDANDCIATADSACVDDLRTGVLSIENKMELKLYPNPANDILYLKYNKDAVSNPGGLKIEILSVSGRVVKIRENIADKIDISYLDEGIYFINIITGEGSFHRKFVKIK
jgi:hypothetical protein